jgi:hypothetical protein
MSDFWGLSDGSSATDTDENFELAGGGNLDPIPEGSTVIALIEGVGWKLDKDNNEFLEVKWRVAKPEAFANRVVFQKLWVKDADPRAKDEAAANKKRDNARRLFARIDSEAGGKLARSGKSNFTNDELAIALQNKAMAIKVMVWAMKGSDGSDMSGNWIAAVMSKSKPVEITSAAPPKAQAAKVQTSQGFVDFDDDSDVPF